MVLVGFESGEVVALEISAEGLQLSRRLAAGLDSEPTALALIKPENVDGPLVAGLADGRVVLLVEEVDSEKRPVNGLALDITANRVVPFADRPAASASYDPGVSVAVLGRDGACDVVGLPLTAPRIEDAFTSFAPTMPITAASLIEHEIRPARDVMRVLALSAQTRRLAIVRGNAVEIRPFTYTLPPAPAASDVPA